MEVTPKQRAENRVQALKQVLEVLNALSIDGVRKIASKFQQELVFLDQFLADGSIPEECLTNTSLKHLEAVTSQMLISENICSGVMVQKPLTYADNSCRKLTIDLVLLGGTSWVKVIAKSKKALTIVTKGSCSYRKRSIIDQAKQFIECSKQNICLFRPPTVTFSFTNGIDDKIAAEIKKIGVIVKDLSDGLDLEEVVSRASSQRRCECDRRDPRINTISDVEVINGLKIKKLNLGVTTMMAYVSALTNGGSYMNYMSENLATHAKWERMRPVKPILDRLFEGKRLYACRTAVLDFQKILSTLGGEGERKRGEELMKRVIVVDDHPTPRLKVGGKIKQRSIIIFGTGEHLRAITVTANSSFVRSARDKGVTFEVFVHEARALTEKKQIL